MPIPLDRPTVRWGILGTGRIAASFTRDLAVVPGAEAVAVGSRSQSSADRFAGEQGVARAHDSYQELVDNPDVDVVYVASPHSEHLAHGLLALRAGKPVLVEKSLTITADEAEQLFMEAATRDLFVMEAMWTACHPVIKEVRRLLATGEHGQVFEVVAGLGFAVEAGDDDRLLAPALGGGALLDMGVYPVWLAQMLLGDPAQQVAAASLSSTGIDLGLTVSASYASGAVAALSASMVAWSPRTATIATDTGRFDLPPGFHHPRHATWTPYLGGREVGEPVTIVAPADDPVLGSGLGNEAAEVGRCLRAGARESALVPWADSLSVMRQMDDLRRQIGVRYAGHDD